jgi:hypothetical protein
VADGRMSSGRSHNRARVVAGSLWGIVLVLSLVAVAVVDADGDPITSNVITVVFGEARKANEAEGPISRATARTSSRVVTRNWAEVRSWVVGRVWTPWSRSSWGPCSALIRGP